jgi:SWI/SNF-related matrix-associated actin-dependent regulator 1 of chromatin subfamily A
MEKREVKATIGRMIRLDCKHLIMAKLTIEEEQKAIEAIQEDIKADTLIKAPTIEEIVFDKTQFHNSKTFDTPYPYQHKGIQFAIDNAFRVLIADEQGLGKTVQALGVLHYAMKHNLLNFFPVLLLVKSSIKMQWLVSLINWCGMDYLPQIISDGKTPPVEGFNVCIASYDILRKFSTKEDTIVKSAWGHEIKTKKVTNPFYDFPFKTVIMDEVQLIKGDSTRTKEVVRVAEGKNIIALSGTPIKNNAAEYFTILNLLAPDKFPTKKGFLDRWVKTEIVNGYEKYTGLWNPERFADYTKNIVLRRTREDVKEEIGLRVTKANRIFYHVDFESDKLKAEYEKAEMQFIREMEKETARKNPLEMIARLSVMRHLIGLNKIQPTVDLAVEYLLENPSGKLLIFAHHKDVMDTIAFLLSKWCLEGGYATPQIYHSGLNQQQRYDLVTKFITPGKESSPFLIGSTLAMSEGVDRLQQVCNDCIIAERQWNPANEEQAESRLVRIGQKRSFVNATYPIASGTIDEYFTEIVERKRKAMKETLDGKKMEWSEDSLLTALYDILITKGRKNIRRGF